MFWYLTRWFRMSKWQYVGYALLWTVIAVCFQFIGLPYCNGVFWMFALIMGAAACYKFLRDVHITELAKLDSKAEPEVLPPPMTSPGSSRLFVPPPLNQR